jgi:hypothetical protein
MLYADINSPRSILDALTNIAAASNDVGWASHARREGAQGILARSAAS